MARGCIPRDGRVVSNFIMQALSGEPITIYGDGQQTRSFCYVDDLIDGLVRLIDSAAEVTGPINLGNPTEFTIRELAETVIDMTGSKSQDRQEAVARRRSAPAPAEHREGAGPARVGAQGRASRRAEKTIAYFQEGR